MKKLWCPVLLFLLILPLTGQAQEKPFLSQEIESDARQFEEYLKEKWSTAGDDAKGWRRKGEAAVKAQDARRAAGFFASAAVLDKSDAEVWLALARAYLAIETNNYQEKQSFPRNAGSAALIAFERAQTPQAKAAALGVLGQSLAQRSMWRPAIETYKAGLRLAERADIRQAYEQLKAEHGFRMLDYSVDSDAASPRLCIQFSETLAKGRIDFAKFVTVNGEDPAAVKAENQQLCVEELLHGRRYEIRIRSGLPSSVDETLPKPLDLTVYVRDRKPVVRFTGRNYVLPRSGQQGIPLVSVNTKTVKIEIFHIGDRRLAHEVLEGDFAQQLTGHKAKQISENHGERLWGGEMPVKMTLNEEVTTAFPIDELAPNLKSGLYVMVASPEGASKDEDWEQKATQWFVVSDLGLAALSGQDGIHAFVRSLASAAPLTGAEIRLIARNNEVLATAKSDAQGYVRFDAGLARGTGGLAPALLVARTGEGDYGFLDLSKSAFDLSDRGVGGRQTPGPLDALVFAERGVYRPGESVFITTLLRDQAGRAAATPLTLKIIRPDQVEHKRELLRDQGHGGRSLTLPLAISSMTGTWRVSAHSDPKGPAIGETAFLVEDYVPERLEMTLEAKTPSIAPDKPAVIHVSGRYLYGAPAANLALEGEITVAPGRAGPEKFPGYRFGLDTEKVQPKRQPLSNLPNTGPNGEATVQAALPPLPETTQPLDATIVLRLREPSGRTLERSLKLPVKTPQPLIGVKPLFSGGHVSEGGAAAFDVIALDADGRQTALKGLNWELLKIETRFQWYSRHGRWDFEPVTAIRRIANGVIDSDAAKPVKIEAPTGYGRYRLEITAANPQGPATSVTFSSGWYVSETADTPDILELALDKASYRAGDEVKVKITPRMGGEAVIAVVSDKLLAMKFVSVPEGGATASFTMDKDWGAGAYVTAMLYRPMHKEAKRMPGRAIGVKWLPLDKSVSTLGVAVGAPEKARPNQRLSLPVTLSGLKPGEKAYVTVAAVDLGILNLTNYAPPAPENYYFGQRRLGTEIRDLYGKLIDGMQGVRGTIRSGGDGGPGGLAMQGRPLNAEPIAFYSGIAEVKEDGAAIIAFDIPAFDGTLRVMAAAWSGDKLGHGVKDVIIRDPVVAVATPPRFLTIGDKSELHLSLQNVEGPEGRYEFTAQAEGGVALTDGSGAFKREIALKAQERISLAVPLKAGKLGAGKILVALNGPGGLKIERQYALSVEPAAPNIVRRSVHMVAAKTGSLTLSADLITGLIPETVKVSVNAGRSAAMDVPGLLLALDRYPYGCAEQIVSRALPLLYFNQVADAAGIAGEKGADERIKHAIERLAALQDAGGSFGLWSAGSQDLWLTAYVTDFLARAKEKGYAIRSIVLESAIDRLKNSVNAAADFQTGGEELAYALYVLARSGRAVVGDLRYYADTKLDSFATPLAQAQLGAALAMYGDKERAERAFSAALGRLKPAPDLARLALRTDYGTALRDGAAALTLISETGTLTSAVPGIAENVQKLRALQGYTTTQENAWLLLAARALIEESRDLAFEVNGKAQRGPLQTVLKAGDLQAKGFQLRNLASQPVPATVMVTGASETPESAAASGFRIERRVYTPEGSEVKFERVKQNSRFVVVLKVSETEAKLGHILIEDRLPAGFEIENPKLLKSADVKAFAWLQTEQSPAHTAFRDEKFIAAFSLSDANRTKPAEFHLAYVMRAVMPGSYLHPGAQVEDMYRPDRFARTDSAKVEIVREQP